MSSAGTVVAKRYARALFEVAQERNIVSKVEEELKTIVAVVEQNEDFRKLLQHPNVDAAVKIDIIKEAFAGNLSEPAFNTIQLLVERGRETVLEQLLDAFVAIANEALGQANAMVYTPFPLSESEATKIADQFGELIGKKIRLDHVIDKSLLGGFQVRIGDRLYDGSLSGKLARLEKTLKQSQVQ
jgi:F-type H+-transporting ATPase subunit delta